jgi:hypothetical protein
MKGQLAQILNFERREQRCVQNTYTRSDVTHQNFEYERVNA